MPQVGDPGSQHLGGDSHVGHSLRLLSELPPWRNEHIRSRLREYYAVAAKISQILSGNSEVTVSQIRTRRTEPLYFHIDQSLLAGTRLFLSVAGNPGEGLR